MAAPDRRRRRQTSHSESEHSENEDNDKDSVRGGATSEGEKVESDEEDDYTYTEDETCTEYGEGDSVIIEEEFDDAGWVDGERQSGDGAEEQPDSEKKKLDDDQDRKNPAYVPRKGAFYEHDFRDGDGDNKNKEVQDEREKKKLWTDTGKWHHDKFSEQDQAPKSREELMAIYGYDIRASDKLPDMVKRKPRRAPMDRKSELMDFLDKSRFSGSGQGGQGDYRRGGRGGWGQRGRGRGRGRGFSPQQGEGGPPRRNYSGMRGNYHDNNQQHSPRYNDSNNQRYNDQENNEDQQNQDPQQQYQQRNPPYREPSPKQSQQRPVEGEQTQPTPVLDAPEQQQQQPPQQPPQYQQQPQRRTPPRQQQHYQQQQQHQRGGPPPLMGHNNHHQQQHHQQPPMRGGGRGGRVKSITPDRIPPKKNIEGVLECAPPLTVVETRTTSSSGMDSSSGDVRKSYAQNRRGGMNQPPQPQRHLERMSVPSSFQNSSTIGPPPGTGPGAPRGFAPPNTPPRQQQQQQQQQPQDARQTKRYSTQRQRVQGDMAQGGGGPMGPTMQPQQQHQQQQRPMRPQQRMQGPQGGQMRSQQPPPRGMPQQPRGHLERPPFFRPPVFQPRGGQQVGGPQRYPGDAQSPPHTVTSFPQPLPRQPPPQQIVYTTMPVTSQMQSPPRLVYNPASGPVPISVPAQHTMVPPPQYIAAAAAAAAAGAPPPTIVNFAPQAAGYQIAGPAVPMQFPPPPAVTINSGAVTLVSTATSGLIPSAVAPPPAASAPSFPPNPTSQGPAAPPAPGQIQGNPPAIQMRGGTTYFSPNIQTIHSGRSPARRPKAAIPIVNPQDLSGQEYYTYQEYEEQEEYTVEYNQSPLQYTGAEYIPSDREQYAEGYTEAQDDDEYTEEHGEGYTEEQGEGYTETQEEEYTEAQAEDYTEDYTEDKGEENTENVGEEYTEDKGEQYTEDQGEQYTEDQGEQYTEDIGEQYTEEKGEQYTEDKGEPYTEAQVEEDGEVQEEYTEDQGEDFTEAQEENNEEQLQEHENIIVEKYSETTSDHKENHEQIVTDSNIVKSDEPHFDTAVENREITQEQDPAQVEVDSYVDTSGDQEFLESVEQLALEDKDVGSTNNTAENTELRLDSKQSLVESSLPSDIAASEVNVATAPLEAEHPSNASNEQNVEEEEFVECSEEQTMTKAPQVLVDTKSETSATKEPSNSNATEQDELDNKASEID